MIEDWNAKVGSQEIPGVTGKFGLGVQNEAGQRLIQFSQFAGILSAALSQHYLLGFEIAQLEFHHLHLPLALFVVMLPKAHLTLHSRMSGSK